MTLKKLTIAFAAVAIIAGLVGGARLLAQAPPAWFDVYEGEGRGTVIWDNQTIRPWADWWVHSARIYPSGGNSIVPDSSGWYDNVTGAYGWIKGWIDPYTHQGRGTWGCDNPADGPHGTWEGTFYKSIPGNDVNGIWKYYNEQGVLVDGGSFWGEWIRTYRVPPVE